MIFSDIFARFFAQNFKTKILTAQKNILLECLGLPSEWGSGIRLESCLCGGRGREEREEREEVLSISEVSDWVGSGQIWSNTLLII